MAHILKGKIRFHYWTTALLCVFVVTLTAAILVTVFDRFEKMAEENAKTVFSQITTRSATELQRLVTDSSRFLRIETDRHAGHDGEELSLRFMAALEQYPEIYAYYHGRPDGDFLQVIGARGDARILKTLTAPPGTWFAERRITHDTDGQRIERWRFLSATRELLGVAEHAARYDPRGRPWYDSALAANDVVVTEPYTFQSTGELGLTLASPRGGDQGVIGADVALSSLNQFLKNLSDSVDGGLVVLDQRNRLIALQIDPRHRTGNLAPLVALAQTGNPYLRQLEDWTGTADRDGRQIRTVDGEKYVYTQYAFSATPDVHFRVAAFAPMVSFSAPIDAARDRILLIAALVLLVTLPLAAIGSQRVSRALRTLARDSERVRQLDFSGPPQARSLFHEIDSLGRAHEVMKDSIQSRTEALTISQDRLHSLVEIGMLLSMERDRTKLLRHILAGGTRLCNCEAGTLYLVTEHGTLRFALRTMDDAIPSFELPLTDENGRPNEQYVSTFVATRNRTVAIDDVYAETRFDVSGTRRFDQQSGHHTVSMLTVPIAPRDGEVIGVLQFLNARDVESGAIVSFSAELVELVEALASQAAIALDNQQLAEAQVLLLDSVIRIIAGAIDAKSAYTGGHCERVPELAFMLAEEACRTKEGPLADFDFRSEEEWREFRIGAWLHDCGKVTTPEFVVDKATKIETIYNRIHEVRTRFEVLLRDAEIERLQALLDGADAGAALQAFDARKAQLLDDFRFIAECNVGGEFMAQECMERVRAIAAQTWLRHFDDRLGLSHEERKRADATPAQALPAQEQLLADKPHHIIPRTAAMVPDARYGFKVKVPEHLYNFGEVYNLCIARGTLNEEERFKINDHIIQTIVMLDKLPLPKQLRRVPEYAGTHHETMIGTGYPRQLTRDDMSVPSRIMAVADIFEALTASDRPYKQAKTLSESIRILSFFKKDQHIDGDVFDLFLRSGVYLRYAQRFLKPEQIDEVDISLYVG